MISGIDPVPSEFSLLDLCDWLKEQEEHNPKFDEYTAHGSYLNYYKNEDYDDWDEYMINIETKWGELLESKWTQKDLYEILQTCSFDFRQNTKVNDYSYVDDLSREWKFSIVKLG